MALPQTRIQELQQTIHGYLSKVNVQSRLQAALASSDPEDDSLIDKLEESGIVDEILYQFTGKEQKSSPQKKSGGDFLYPGPDLLTRRSQLRLHVQQGKAFTAHLLDNAQSSSSPTYALHVMFRGQRFKSAPTRCAESPEFREIFLMDLSSEGQDQILSGADLLAIADKIHMVLVKTDVNGDTHLISSHYLDWRTVLNSPQSRQSLSVEMSGVGTESNVPVGILDIVLELLPGDITIAADVISTQTELEHRQQAERDRLFLLYTKQWWREYLQVRPSHEHRIVKLYAQDENGINRPVTSYVQPLRAGRLLENPRRAARFVSLIKYNRASSIGTSNRAEQWMSLHAFLCANRGDVENHATLLCSFLLGFGLDAYVCLGTKNKSSSHAWVLTVGPDDGVVTFWESLTGNRYTHRFIKDDELLIGRPPAKQPSHPYRTVACLFNHSHFYANMQVNDAVETTDFDLSNDGLWKGMAAEAIASVCAPSVSWMSVPALQRSLLDTTSLSNEMEVELRALISEYRQTEGLSVAFDDRCCYILGMALSAYETERVLGQTMGTEEFSQAVTNTVPEGHTFKAYPIQFLHTNTKRCFAAALKSKTCREVIGCRGDNVHMAVRVCIYSYPESAVATWIMFACRYKCVL